MCEKITDVGRLSYGHLPAALFAPILDRIIFLASFFRAECKRTQFADTVFRWCCFCCYPLANKAFADESKFWNDRFAFDVHCKINRRCDSVFRAWSEHRTRLQNFQLCNKEATGDNTLSPCNNTNSLRTISECVRVRCFDSIDNCVSIKRN